VNEIAPGGFLVAKLRRPPFEGRPLDTDILVDNVTGYAVAKYGQRNKHPS